MLIASFDAARIDISLAFWEDPVAIVDGRGSVDSNVLVRNARVLIHELVIFITSFPLRLVLLLNWTVQQLNKIEIQDRNSGREQCVPFISH